MKIKIGEKEYELPFRYDEEKNKVVDGENLPMCDLDSRHCVFGRTTEQEAALGQFIASALNSEKRIAELEEERELSSGWHPIESGLPEGIKLLWQLANSTEYLIGIWDGKKVCGQFHTEFDLIRFSACRELPSPYMSDCGGENE